MCIYIYIYIFSCFANAYCNSFTQHPLPLVDIEILFSTSQYCRVCCCLVAKLCTTLATPQTVAYQAPLSRDCQASILEWVAISFHLQEIFPICGLNPHLLHTSLALQVDSATTEPPGKPIISTYKLSFETQGISQATLQSLFQICAITKHIQLDSCFKSVEEYGQI